jgi:hypothetical protein
LATQLKCCNCGRTAPPSGYIAGLRTSQTLQEPFSTRALQ